jgi:hypothetical protein
MLSIHLHKSQINTHISTSHFPGSETGIDWPSSTLSGSELQKDLPIGYSTVAATATISVDNNVNYYPNNNLPTSAMLNFIQPQMSSGIGAMQSGRNLPTFLDDTLMILSNQNVSSFVKIHWLINHNLNVILVKFTLWKKSNHSLHSIKTVNKFKEQFCEKTTLMNTTTAQEFVTVLPMIQNN